MYRTNEQKIILFVIDIIPKYLFWRKKVCCEREKKYQIYTKESNANQFMVNIFFQAINDCELLNRGLDMSFECTILIF